MNPINRRKLLKILSLSAVCWLDIGSTRADSVSSSHLKTATLNMILDQLIPADGYSPSAHDLDVLGGILALASEIPNYALMLRLGTEWIEKTSTQNFQKNFASLSVAERDRVLIAASKEPHQTLPRVFFDRVRNDAMTLFYGDTRSYGGLLIDGPIQPHGYPDFSESPISRD